MDKGRLTFGMPTLIELPDMAANVRLCRQLGLSFIELNTDLPAYQPAALPADVLANATRQEGVQFTVHLPEKLDLGAFQEDIRKGHLACLTRTIQWGRQAGIGKLNMHLNPGVYFTLPRQRVWLYEKHLEPYLANLRESLDAAMDCAGRADVALLVENAGSFQHGFLQKAVGMMLGRYAQNLGLTWDVGHDAESGYSDSQVIRQHLDRVAHMHLHDFDGKSAHQPLFTGSVDIPAMLSIARQRQANIVVETKTVQALAASIEALKSRGLM